MDAPEVFPVLGERRPLFATQMHVSHDCHFSDILHAQRPWILLVRDSSFLLALARRTLDRYLQSLLSGFRYSLDVAYRRHLVCLGNLRVCCSSLEFLLTEWFDHFLEALRIIGFWFEMLKVWLKSGEFAKTLRPIINIWAQWLVLRPSMCCLELVDHAVYTLLDLGKRVHKVWLMVLQGRESIGFLSRREGLASCDTACN